MYSNYTILELVISKLLQQIRSVKNNYKLALYLNVHFRMHV